MSAYERLKDIEDSVAHSIALGAIVDPNHPVVFLLKSFHLMRVIAYEANAIAMYPESGKPFLPKEGKSAIDGVDEMFEKRMSQ